MLRKEIKFTDYNGTERMLTAHFNLSKAELIEMDLMTPGGMQQMLQRIVDEKDSVKIMSAFKDIILKSYGVKSDDGMRFEKSPELSEAFSQTEAYSELFMELLTNTDAAAAFVNGIIPREARKQ